MQWAHPGKNGGFAYGINSCDLPNGVNVMVFPKCLLNSFWKYSYGGLPISNKMNTYNQIGSPIAEHCNSKLNSNRRAHDLQRGVHYSNISINKVRRQGNGIYIIKNQKNFKETTCI